MIKTVEDFLKEDKSYIPEIWHSNGGILSGVLSGMHSLATKDYTELRRAYESGVRVGYELGIKAITTSYIHPYNEAALSSKEYQNFMTLLSLFGYEFRYIANPANKYATNTTSMNEGLNILKNSKAIEAGITISEDVKNQVYELLKKHSDSRLWCK